MRLEAGRSPARRRPLAALAVGVIAALSTASARADDPLALPRFIDPAFHIDQPALPPGLVIRFLTTDDHPPFNFVSPDGTLVGYNVDLARAICAELGVTCTIQARGFETLVSALDAKAGDAVIASLAMTPQSRSAVSFTLPTMRVAARFAARLKDAPATVLPESVGRLVIGVQGGTAHEAYLRRFFPMAVLKTYTDPDSLHLALSTGAVDLIFADGVATALWLNGSSAAGCCRFAGGPYTETHYFGEGTGIAVRKGDAALRQALNYALQRLSISGKTADLMLQYFPRGVF